MTINGNVSLKELVGSYPFYGVGQAEFDNVTNLSILLLLLYIVVLKELNFEGRRPGCGGRSSTTRTV